MRSTLKTESVGCVSTAIIGRLCSPLVVLTQVKKSKVTVHSMIKLSLHDVLDSLVGRNCEHCEHARIWQVLRTLEQRPSKVRPIRATSSTPPKNVRPQISLFGRLLFSREHRGGNHLSRNVANVTMMDRFGTIG